MTISICFTENVDQIDECGNLDYTVLKPVLERAKPDDLMRIEEYNPKLMDDTGEYNIFEIKVIFFFFCKLFVKATCSENDTFVLISRNNLQMAVKLLFYRNC